MAEIRTPKANRSRPAKRAPSPNDTLGRSIALGVHKSIRKLDLRLDLLSVLGCRARQIRNLGERASELSRGSPFATPVIGNPTVHAENVQDVHGVECGPLADFVREVNVAIDLIP
jgi:hypothetical protein